MCTYNGARFLREQLDSLVAQDYPNLEIIITDDCSTDDTFDILKEFEDRYEYIQAIRNENNLGFLKNFEKAISLCAGEFIALCDQDDIWFPNKISTLVDKIDSHNLIYSRASLIDQENQSQGDFLASVDRLSGHCNRALIMGNCVVGHTCMFPRKILEHACPFPAGIDFHDHWIAFVAATEGTILYLDEPLSSYRMHENNVTIDLPKDKSRRKTFREKREKQKKRKSEIQQSIRRLNAWLTLDLLNLEERALIKKVIRLLRISPWCYYNRLLHLFLQRQPELLTMHQDKERAIRHYSRGPLLRF